MDRLERKSCKLVCKKQAILRGIFKRTHILHSQRHSSKKETIIKPTILLPVRKKLPSLGFATVDSRSKDEEDKQAISTMEDQTDAKRIEPINNGKRDKMTLKQARCAPQLSVNDVI